MPKTPPPTPTVEEWNPFVCKIEKRAVLGKLDIPEPLEEPAERIETPELLPDMPELLTDLPPELCEDNLIEIPKHEVLEEPIVQVVHAFEHKIELLKLEHKINLVKLEHRLNAEKEEVLHSIGEKLARLDFSLPETKAVSVVKTIDVRPVTPIEDLTSDIPNPKPILDLPPPPAPKLAPKLPPRPKKKVDPEKALRRKSRRESWERLTGGIKPKAPAKKPNGKGQ